MFHSASNIAVKPLLRMTGMDKSFPGVQALKSAALEVSSGEVHALVGENGAGKSTLIKILSGAITADRGEIQFKGKKAGFTAPHQARKAGISVIYQEFTLVPFLTVSENIFLGREITKQGIIDQDTEKHKTKEILSKLEVEINPEAPVFSLNIAQQQLVEIARALSGKAELMVMDEPTAALSPQETAKLFAVIRQFIKGGGSVIFISHKLDEVLNIARRITVMRDGMTIGCYNAGEISKAALIEAMVGRPMEREFPLRNHSPDAVYFEVRNLSGGKINNVSFSVRKGEVLGLAGLMGAGRTDIVRLIFGADKRSRGEFSLDGRIIEIDSPRAAIAAGICLLTEDRKAQGLILRLSAKDNFSISNLKEMSKWGWIKAKDETSRFAKHIDNLKIRLSSMEQRADSLSGGNQQKLLLARWLESDSKVIIFDEPTRGIDVGAKYEIYQLIDNLAASGKAVIIISSELQEIMGICDRILVVRKGSISQEIADIAKSSQQEIMRFAID